jgi:Leucine-rich repeat (LRR) protein
MATGKLVELDISYNQMRRYPAEIEELKGLQFLGLGHNGLHSISEDFGRALFGLREIHLLGNKVTALPDSFQALKFCQYLSIASNLLEYIPNEIGGMEYLTELDLHDNRLTGLPPSFAQIPSLEKLWLQDNLFVAIPKQVTVIPLLLELDVSGNPRNNSVSLRLPTIWVRSQASMARCVKKSRWQRPG